MSDIERLAPHYLSDFFAFWYTDTGRVIIAVFLFLLPSVVLALSLFEQWLRKRRGQDEKLYKGVPDPVFFVAALVRWRPRRSRLLLTLLAASLLLAIIYFLIHRRISLDPSWLTTGPSLQQLSQSDVVALVQFLQRWVIAAWSLMFIVLTLVFAYLAEGWALLPDAVGPRLAVQVVQDGGSDLHYRTSGAENEVRMFLSYTGDVTSARADKAPKPTTLVEFKCETSPSGRGPWRMFCHPVDTVSGTIEVTYKRLPRSRFGRVAPGDGDRLGATPVPVQGRLLLSWKEPPGKVEPGSTERPSRERRATIHVGPH